jgi:hypothetical protein
MPLSEAEDLMHESDFHKNVKDLQVIVEKYHRYSFQSLPNLIDPDILRMTDPMNMYFRYPDKEVTNKAIRRKHEDFYSIDIRNYLESNFEETMNIDNLIKEIRSDMNIMFNISRKIGANLAENVSRNS